MKMLLNLKLKVYPFLLTIFGVALIISWEFLWLSREGSKCLRGVPIIQNDSRSHGKNSGVNQYDASVGATVNLQGKVVTGNVSPKLEKITLGAEYSSWRKCWRYDSTKWTMTAMHPGCRVPEGFKKRNSVIKRVIYFNKTIEYTVCNKSTKKCREQPYFSWRLKKMVERPPCCIAHVLETFKRVTEMLDEAKIRYFLVAGGLVGWVKNRSIPRYENDLDLLIDGSKWKQFKSDLKKVADKHGHYVKFLKRLPNFVRVFYSKLNRVYIDTWPYRIIRVNGSKWVKPVSSLTWYPFHYSSIFPLRRGVFSGIPIWVPNDPELVLDRHYKNRFNWRGNVTCKEKNRKKCMS